MHLICSIKVAAIATLAFFATSVTAQASLHLLCSGDLETTTDFVKKERTQETVDVVVDLGSSTIEIDGYWGCLADLGTSDPTKYKCLGKQQITVSDPELRYFAQSESETFEGQTSVTINRYSGTFSINSTGLARPAAKAIWSFVSVTGRLQCSRQTKSF